MPAPTFDLTFPHSWEAEILVARPLILPTRHSIYPRDAEEVERGALEVLIRPHAVAENHRSGPQPFLATCALGFRDPAVPTGVWACPHPDELCAISGGYAYLVDTTAPERFTMLPYRPVLEVRSLPAQGLLLFVGHHSILAWGGQGEAWQSEKLSDEGVTLGEIDGDTLRGMGWRLMTDKETPFAIDLRSGKKID
ncbi:MAG: hypothetical protein WCC26_04850 [Terracidiphilus sp.]